VWLVRAATDRNPPSLGGEGWSMNPPHQPRPLLNFLSVRVSIQTGRLMASFQSSSGTFPSERAMLGGTKKSRPSPREDGGKIRKNTGLLT